MNQKLNLLAAAALLSVNAACTAEGAAANDGRSRDAAAAPAQSSVPAAPRVVTITSSDFAFGAPDTLTAGAVTLRLVNQGPEMHHAQLVRIDEGHTVQELVDRVKAGELSPSWIRYVGGPNAPAPGEASNATVQLEAGDYALVCLIPSPDGVPHLMKGMVKPLVVTPAAQAQAQAAAPAPDVRMVLTDYAFQITPEIRAGRHTLGVENTARQPHEVILVRLAPGKTAQEMADWLHAPAGPPPGMPLGGTTLLSQGESNTLAADLAPGEYALLCMVPDATDGKPHVAHGMVRQITVR